MSSIRFTSFGAATVPLSKIVVDKDLEMGEYTVIANEVRAGRVYSPIDTEEWETEALEWEDDIDEYSYDNLPAAEGDPGEGYKTILDEFETPPERQYLWEIFANHDPRGYSTRTGRLDVINIDTSGVIASTPSSAYPTTTKVVLQPGIRCSVKFIGTTNEWRSYLNEGSYVKNTGKEWLLDDKTFSLTGRWLALGIDMHGLDATIKVHGTELPYSDYVKCFPLAPTELKIPGGWDASQERPEIKVYK